MRPPAFELRVPTDADAEAWFRLFDDPAVMRYVGDGGVRPLGWYQEFVRRQQALAAETGLCLFAVVRSGGKDARLPGDAGPGVVAGFVGLQPWSQPWGPTGRTEIGWRLGVEHQGSGLATAAARLCLTRAVARGIPNPVSMIHAANLASIAVARKLGMAPQQEHVSPQGAPVVEYGFG